MSGGHSIASGFDDAYAAPMMQKYQDNASVDEGEARWKVEFSRQKLYARGAPQQQPPLRPQSAAQEAYDLPRPEPVPLQASCAACQGTLACHGADAQSAFCLACNQAALAPQRGIPSLIK